MKNTFKVLAFSFAVCALACACNNKPAEVEDTTPADTIMVEDMTADMVAEELAPVEEEVVATKPAKKAEKKINETTVTLDNGATATTANSGKMKKAEGALDNETSKTTKDGTTVTTNQAGKMKKKASNN